jgi:hypothetical protein
MRSLSLGYAQLKGLLSIETDANGSISGFTLNCQVIKHGGQLEAFAPDRLLPWADSTRVRIDALGAGPFH